MTTKVCSHCNSTFQAKYENQKLCYSCGRKGEKALEEHDRLRARAKRADQLERLIRGLPPTPVADAIRRLTECNDSPDAETVRASIDRASQPPSHPLEPADKSTIPPWESQTMYERRPTQDSLDEPEDLTECFSDDYTPNQRKSMVLLENVVLCAATSIKVEHHETGEEELMLCYQDTEDDEPVPVAILLTDENAHRWKRLKRTLH